MACRTARAKRELVRVVRTPDGTVVIDFTGRAAGRGAYLCRDAGCWSAAGRKRAIEHALRTAVPPDVAATLDAGPDALPDMTIPMRGDAPQPHPNPDQKIQGGARGQE